MKTHSPSIVLIDKQSPYITVLSNFIRANEQLDFAVHAAHSAQDGLYLATQLQPNIILMDLNLSSTNGLTLLPQLRRISPRSKIIVTTLSDDPLYRMAAEAAGADAFISKGDIYDRLPTTLLQLSETQDSLLTL